MNNNQDMNINSQNNNYINSQTNLQNNEVNNNSMPHNNINEPNLVQNDNSQTINPFINNDNIANSANKGYVELLKQEGINVQSQSKFISDNSFNETSINDLNIEEDYNNLNKIDYSNDPKVLENLGRIEKKEKATITITKDLKFIIMIALVLFVFILIMPYIFDFLRDMNN